MRLAPLSCLAVALVACTPGTPDQKKPTPVADIGRAETSGIRNTDAIGVGGSQIAGKVDGALDANDTRKATLDAAMAGNEEAR